MLDLLIALAYGLGASYALWVLYLASMALIRAKSEGALSTSAKVLGYPVVGIGLALDFALNMTVLTALFVDPPREKLVTARLRRLAKRTDWRGKMARWLAVELLDPFDPSGRHV